MTATTVRSAVKVTGLRKSFGDKVVLDSIDLAEAASWSVEPSSTPSGSVYTTLESASCVSPTALAVGSLQTVTFDHTSRRPPQNVEIPFAEQWDGPWWAVQPTPSLTSPISSLPGLACTSTIFCLAVGYTGTASSNSTLVEGYG